MEITYKVEATSKKTRVVSLIKESILSGTIQPGEAIVESRMAQQFGVGVGLIREALLDLEHDGFVQRTPFSKTQVTLLTRKDAQQIFDIRILLEPLACELAGRNAAGEQLRELSRIAAKAKHGVDNNDLTAFFGNHLAFRRRLWELSDSRHLQQTLERIVVPLYALYLIRESSNREGLLQVAREGSEHQQTILKNLEGGRLREAAEATADFLVRMKGNLGSKLLP
jgi:DNA-binding GntR family transcriptional regulator